MYVYVVDILENSELYDKDNAVWVQAGGIWQGGVLEHALAPPVKPYQAQIIWEWPQKQIFLAW